jgi:hypothetical protein
VTRFLAATVFSLATKYATIMVSLKMVLEEGGALIFLFSRLRKRRKNGDFGYTQS